MRTFLHKIKNWVKIKLTNPSSLKSSERYPNYEERFPWLGADLQTLRSFLIPKLRISNCKSSGKLTFQMTDGSGDQLTGTISFPCCMIPQLPLIVLIHGLGGCEDSAYMLQTSDYFLGRGYSILRLNLRGVKSAQAPSRHYYHAGRDQDLQSVFKELNAMQLIPNGVIIIGFSLGGNILLKLLGGSGAEYPIRAALSVSAPIDLAMTSERVLQPRNYLYHKWLLHHMKNGILGLKNLNDRQRKTILCTNTVFEFDDRVTAPENGFSGAVDYYKSCSAKFFIHKIKVPTLIVSAKNDPWVPSIMYSSIDRCKLKNVKIILLDGGGHIGFHDRLGCWYHRAFHQFISELSC